MKCVYIMLVEHVEHQCLREDAAPEVDCRRQVSVA